MEENSSFNIKQVTTATAVLVVVLVGAIYISGLTQTSRKATRDDVSHVTMNNEEATYEPLPETVQAIPIVEPVVGVDVIEVVYTDDGFQPSDVRIKRGQSVLFVNKSRENLHVQVAGEARYALKEDPCSPGVFDSCEPLAPQVEWEHTFSEEGVYPYWNAEEKEAKGVVRVI